MQDWQRHCGQHKCV
uniref:Uncharacterized protein n=1 Tax=Anguilla anguilla TaxID=7936 RepID=A0A0E9XI32_ANGAN